MSGTRHLDLLCHSAALRERAERVRQSAIRQRVVFEDQRDRFSAAFGWTAGTTRTHTTTLADYAAQNGRDGQAYAPTVVAFAASAGGLAPLTLILRELPAAFLPAVIVAMHTGPQSTLPRLLHRQCQLHVKYAENGERLAPGVVYVAPPLRHVVVNANRTLAVVERSKIHFARPSADWLFESVASTYGSAATAVVLSGCQRDGARGVIRMREAGSSVFVQDPKSAEASDMPMAAIATGAASAVLPPQMIASAIVDRIHLLDLDRLQREFEDPFAA